MHLHRILAQIDITEEELREAGLPVSGTPDDSNVGELLQIVFGLGGAIALIVITIAGIQFMLSRGDPQKSAIARNAIIYALIGLAVMVVAFSIVSFITRSV